MGTSRYTLTLTALLVSGIALGGLGVLGGCSSGLGQRPIAGDPAGSVADLEGGKRPFAPAAVSIFPLTQLQLDDQGEPWLLLFIELQDRWSDPVKAVGWLTVFLEPADASNGRVHEARWDVDLSDPSVNSALFDPVTRTYRVQLGGLPPRAVAMARRGEQRREGDESASGGSGSVAGSVAGGKMEFRAMFRTLGPGGEELELWDTFVLED